MKKLNFELVNLSDVWDQLSTLFQLHWREIAHYKDIELNPDKEMYFKLDAGGMFRAFMAFDDESGEIVGYQGFFVKHNLHYKQSLNAMQDVLFIHPDYRGRGYEFIEWCDKQLQSEGVQVVFQHMKAKHSFGPTLEKLGYGLQDLIYAKRLDQEG